MFFVHPFDNPPWLCYHQRSHVVACFIGVIDQIQAIVSNALPINEKIGDLKELPPPTDAEIFFAVNVKLEE